MMPVETSIFLWCLIIAFGTNPRPYSRNYSSGHSSGHFKFIRKHDKLIISEPHETHKECTSQRKTRVENVILLETKCTKWSFEWNLNAMSFTPPKTPNFWEVFSGSIVPEVHGSGTQLGIVPCNCNELPTKPQDQSWFQLSSCSFFSSKLLAKIQWLTWDHWKFTKRWGSQLGNEYFLHWGNCWFVTHDVWTKHQQNVLLRLRFPCLEIYQYTSLPPRKIKLNIDTWRKLPKPWECTHME